ncbi:MAG: 50S ribosomal protein L20 [Candidatus Moranbacteria bacterium GW2011_GWE2_35_2-]|nr:MAG: 50S ribosomal protein L20 [Candidatus Moranbacteria bacterium GW2011_GWE2_35_2-]KKQ06770.1 MAG: 50S ribosomal protein L20 [Candidatus Moranbacteria bacterium GW2011_GWF1_36_4]KKQ22482.1 MAG: 50S ribosomal protein L20 [Candidatus Moranbacteria bacterium GW2011_GWF2_37_11]KKQ29551.1 MAG: 50S ribosomal protein L20 [Candidatus Moranbacteria bacterium GW2011_GWD1_37_17]KKQ30579.1 MAG: 50S ribosomal protein L20 [Candidatus Moranbacteria bacterium GW2011_GWE1_37_24]KKQ48197.1 MAG: 50S ribosom
MTRVKRGVAASKRRKNVLKMTKGFRWRRKSNFRAAKEAIMKAGKYAYRDRRTKKRTMRRLWIIRLNNAVRLLGMKYSELIKAQVSKKNILDRKVLSQMAMEDPKVFENFIVELKK